MDTLILFFSKISQLNELYVTSHSEKSCLKSMRNIVQQNKFAISYPLPILMQVLLKCLILIDSRSNFIKYTNLKAIHNSEADSPPEGNVVFYLAKILI